MKRHFCLPKGSYLLSHSIGCLPAGAQADLERRYFTPWRESGGEAWGPWLAEIERFRTLAGRLIGAAPESVCPQTNVSGALSKILHAIPARPGRDRVVLCEEDFPSLGFVVEAAAKVGLQPIFVPRGAAALDPATWRAVVDGRTQLALVSHAFSNRSARLPVAEITRVARERETVTVVDATQTLGVVPIDVTQWSADFLIGSSVKFLCGGPGAALLWAAPDAVASATPIDTGWFSHAEPFAFDIHDYRPADSALRFWGGTPSIAPFVQAAFALELLLGIGIDTIHHHNQALITQLHSRVPDAVIASARDPDRRGNAVLLRVRDTSSARAALAQAGVRADSRDGCIRVSPHLYNDLSDIDRLVGTLQPHF